MKNKDFRSGRGGQGRFLLLFVIQAFVRKEIKEEDILICDQNGRILEGEGKPSKETGIESMYYDRAVGAGFLLSCRKHRAGEGGEGCLRPVPCDSDGASRDFGV